MQHGRAIIRALREEMSQIFLSQGSQQGRCARRLHGTGQQREADRGEWVAFRQPGRANYYLTLGTYTEDEEAVWHRCKSCAAEFPDLRTIQGDR